MRTSMKTIIVIPTYNEKENIAALIPAIFRLGISELEVIVVDDHSPDGTADVARQLSTTYPVHVIERAGKLGLGSAYTLGFAKALQQKADYIFEMDADLSHDPADIPRLLDAAASADIVIGSRKIPGGRIIGWGWVRKWMSSGAMKISRALLNLPVQDVTAGFRCFRRTVLETIELSTIESNGYAFQEELLYRSMVAGFRITEIPVTFIDRQEGKSKLSRKDIFEFFYIILKMKFQKKPPFNT